MFMPAISIITPTWQRPIWIVERCLRSVAQQSFTDWEHIICSDGEEEPLVKQLVESTGDARLRYAVMQPAEREYGNAVRKVCVGMAKGEYCVFLDDDNIIFPAYLEKKIGMMRNNPDAAMVISQLLHFGPLPDSFGKAPQVLRADRPYLQEIDTLQVMIKTAVIAELPWEDKGYLADGYTFQKIASAYPWVSLHEVLAAHL